jgi:N-formylglutamate amidohydrolase
MDLLDQSFTGHGLRVSRNQPYKGGYITDHYGRLKDVEAVQIEMCQRVYMEEDAPEGAPEQPRFSRARELLREVFAALASTIKSRLS